MARRRRLICVLPFVGVILAAGIACYLATPGRLSPRTSSGAGQFGSETSQQVGPGLVRSGDGLTLTVRDNGTERQVHIRKDAQGWIVENYPAGVKPATGVTRVEPFAGARDAPRAPDWRAPAATLPESSATVRR